jgi:hypothetical protein
MFGPLRRAPPGPPVGATIHRRSFESRAEPGKGAAGAGLARIGTELANAFECTYFPDDRTRLER